MVGAAGFEPTTLWSQTRCATRLRYAPTKGCIWVDTVLLNTSNKISITNYGRGSRIRTYDPLVPNQMRYQAALCPVVGAAGFEPTTLWSQTRCATRLRYAPTKGCIRVDTILTLNFKWSGQQDSNLRPSGPKPDALPGCAMPRRRTMFIHERSNVFQKLTTQSFRETLKWSGQQDSNLRPSGPKPDALPGCAMPRSE